MAHCRPCRGTEGAGGHHFISLFDGCSPTTRRLHCSIAKPSKQKRNTHKKRAGGKKKNKFLFRFWGCQHHVLLAQDDCHAPPAAWRGCSGSSEFYPGTLGSLQSRLLLVFGSELHLYHRANWDRSLSASLHAKTPAFSTLSVLLFIFPLCILDLLVERKAGKHGSVPTMFKDAIEGFRT